MINILSGLRVKFHCFQNLNLGKTSTNLKVKWLSHGLHHVNVNLYAKFHHNIPLSPRDRAIFTFSEFGARQRLDRWKMSFRNLKFGLDLVNINVYAKVYQNILLSSRDRAIFTFLEFEPLQRLDQSQTTFDNPLGHILSISMHMQNFIKIFQTV